MRACVHGTFALLRICSKQWMSGMKAVSNQSLLLRRLHFRDGALAPALERALSAGLPLTAAVVKKTLAETVSLLRNLSERTRASV